MYLLFSVDKNHFLPGLVNDLMAGGGKDEPIKFHYFKLRQIDIKQSNKINSINFVPHFLKITYSNIIITVCQLSDLIIRSEIKH